MYVCMYKCMYTYIHTYIYMHTCLSYIHTSLVLCVWKCSAFERALRLSWPAEKQSDAIFLFADVCIYMKFSQDALLWTAKSDGLLFCPANSNAKHFSSCSFCKKTDICFSSWVLLPCELCTWKREHCFTVTQTMRKLSRCTILILTVRCHAWGRATVLLSYQSLLPLFSESLF